MVAQLLLERDDVEVNSKDIHGRTPLFWAAKLEREVVVQLLLQRDDDSKDSYGQAPLLLAAYK